MGLNSIDKYILLGSGQYRGRNSMLNDNHMLEFNRILSSYTNFSMQSSLFLQRPENIIPISLRNESIQILFSGNAKFGHWICIYYNENVIQVFDSMNTSTLSDDHKICINRLFPDNTNLKIVFEKVQQQNNFYNCGLFTIAFAVSLIFNI